MLNRKGKSLGNKGRCRTCGGTGLVFVRVSSGGSGAAEKRVSYVCPTCRGLRQSPGYATK